eukprot:TRINITY_DN12889_c0_g1_i1.p1 TRINITY_DN12889_c0_g1~~TRINITY_DN12889_c0_g1_i1.p1  ORF type:complete len:410 (+),score=97.39 TRINITY_DN12889_c0_g1_i1:123-1232(+)
MLPWVGLAAALALARPGSAAQPGAVEVILASCFDSEEKWSLTAHLRAGTHPSVRPAVNVCAGRHWEGWITKVTALVDFVRGVARRAPQAVVVFGDADDVVFNALSREEVLARFNRIRRTAEIVLGTEVSCYLGNGRRGCDADQYGLLRRGLGVSRPPGGHQSRFVNAGTLAGTARAVARMWGDIAAAMRAQSPPPGRHPLGCEHTDDQCQLVTHALLRPAEVALDYRQELLGNVGFRLSAPEARRGFKGRPAAAEAELRPLCEYGGWHMTCYESQGTCCTHPWIPDAVLLNVTDPCRVARSARRLVSSPEWGALWGRIAPIDLGWRGLSREAPLALHFPGGKTTRALRRLKRNLLAAPCRWRSPPRRGR